MKKLLWLVIIAAALWSGYWAVGAQGTKSAVAKWLEDRRVEGWQVEFSDHAVRGYPNRFDTTLTDVALTDPETGVSWSAPFFQVFALSYQPNELIAVWPKEQQVATPFQRIKVISEEMQASVAIKPSTALELARATMIAANASLTSSEGWTAGLDKLSLAIRETEGTELSYDIGAQVDRLIPGAPLRKLLDQGGTLPDVIEGVRLDAVIGVTEPLSRRTIERARPQLTRLKLNEARGVWGELELRFAGDLEVDAAGYPTGDLAVNARSWREMIALAVTAGALDADIAQGLELGLGFIARTGGNDTTLDITLSFRDTRMFVGPLPVGTAPRLVLR